MNGNYTIILLMPATDKFEEITARTICSRDPYVHRLPKVCYYVKYFQAYFSVIIGPKMNYI